MITPPSNTNSWKWNACKTIVSFLGQGTAYFQGSFLLLVSGRVIWRNCQASILTPLTFDRQPKDHWPQIDWCSAAGKLPFRRLGCRCWLEMNLLGGWSGGMGCLFFYCNWYLYIFSSFLLFLVATWFWYIFSRPLLSFLLFHVVRAKCYGLVVSANKQLCHKNQLKERIARFQAQRSWMQSMNDATADGWNPANQLRLVVSPLFCLGFYIHPRWCRISSINGIDWFSMCLGNDILWREAFDNAARWDSKSWGWI